MEEKTEKVLSFEELVAENEELKKKLENQKKYAAGLSKQLKDQDVVKPSGPVKSLTF